METLHPFAKAAIPCRNNKIDSNKGSAPTRHADEVALAVVLRHQVDGSVVQALRHSWRLRGGAVAGRSDPISTLY